MWVVQKQIANFFVFVSKLEPTSSSVLSKRSTNWSSIATNLSRPHCCSRASGRPHRSCIIVSNQLTALRRSARFGCGCPGVNIYRLGTPRGRSAELEERRSLVKTARQLKCTYVCPQRIIVRNQLSCRPTALKHHNYPLSPGQQRQQSYSSTANTS